MDNENQRGTGGVVFSILDLPDDKVRICMDEVSNTNYPLKGMWQDAGFIASQDYEISDFEDMNFSVEDLQRIGSYVLAWLSATRQHPYK